MATILKVPPQLDDVLLVGFVELIEAL